MPQGNDRLNQIIKALSGIRSESDDVNKALSTILDTLYQLSNSANKLEGAKGFEELGNGAKEVEGVIEKLSGALGVLHKSNITMFNDLGKSIRTVVNDTSRALDKIYELNAAASQTPRAQTFRKTAEQAGLYQNFSGIPPDQQITESIGSAIKSGDVKYIPAPRVLPTEDQAPAVVGQETDKEVLDRWSETIRLHKERTAAAQEAATAEQQLVQTDVTAAEILRDLDTLSDQYSSSMKERAAATQQASTAEQEQIDLLKKEIAARQELARQQAAPPPAEDITGLAGRGTGGDFVPGTNDVRIIRGNQEEINRVLGSGEQLTRRVRDTQQQLTEAWKRSGVELTNFKVDVDAAANSLKVYADIAQQGVTADAFTPEIQGSKIAQQTVDLTSGQIIDPAVQVQRVLKDMGAGAAEFTKIESAVRKAGFAMKDFKRDFGETNDGLRKLQFESVGATGAVSRHSVVLDKGGKIVDTVKSKYEGLSGAISNNVSKVLRWGIAVGLVYGTMNKVRDAISEMITMQDALADVQIVTGRASSELAADLEAVAEAAAETGVTLGEAVGVYRQALQAAGRYSTEAERLARAQTLVTDSLVLARLGNIDTAKALDSLVGALRQSNLEIDQGAKLIDSWVATSKTAKVSLEDLAESFAITAAQASAVGVSTDELNGIIGTIAEVTTLSSTEIGNLGRTLLSSFEAGEAVAALREHGIVVKDVAGEYRDWNDVMQDISDLYQAGAINEKELSAIGRALGGGARRGPQVVAFIKEYSRVNEIAATSAEANGDAADALDIKMDTLSNTVKKLQVALSQLAQTAGAEGGLLSFLTDVVDFSTGAVGAIDGLTDSLGEMVTVLTTLGIASVAISKLDVAGRLGASRLGKGVTGGISGIGMQQQSYWQREMGIEVGKSTGQKFLNFAKAGAPIIGAGIGAGALTYMSTGSAVEGIGAAIGGGIGMYLGGPAGALIGTVIGQKIGSVFQAELDREESRRKLETGELTEVGQIINAIQLEAAGGVGARHALPTDISDPEKLSRALDEWIEVVSSEIDEAPERLQGTFPVIKARETVSVIEDLNNALKENIRATEESTESKEQENEFAERRASIRAEYEPGLDAALDAARTDMITKLGASEISRSDYTRFQQGREIAPGITTNIFDLLEPELDQFGGKSKKTFEELGVDLATALDPRALEYFQDRLSEIAALRTAINDIKNDTTATVSQLSYAAQLESQLAQERRVVAQELNAMIEEAKASLEEIHTPSFTRRPEELTPELANQAMEIAKANQEMYAQMQGLDPGKFAEMADSFVELWEADDRLRELTGVHKLFWDDAVGLALAAAQAMEEAQDQFSVRRLQDVDPGQFGEIQARNRYWIEFLARMRGQTAEQYLGDEGFEENLILGPNNVWQKLLTTNEAMSFTLQDILETEKKQLEGMWNIPEGATFWVPLTSLFYQNQQDGGGVPELPPIDEALVDEIKALKDALAGAGAFAGFDPIEGEAIDDARAQAAQDRKDAEERALNLEDAPGALATRQGNTFIEAIEALSTKADDPRTFLTQALAAIQDVQELGITDEGELDIENAATIGDAISASMTALLVPALASTFKDTFGSKLDEPKEFSIVEDAINQLLDATAPEDVGARAPGEFPGAAESVRLLNTAVSLMTSFVERPPVNISIETGDVTRSIEMTSTVILDGQVLKRWVSNWVATEVNRLSRAQGFS